MVACPKCRKYMFTGRHGGAEIDLCSGCHGIWLDASELAVITGMKSDFPEPQAPLSTSFSCPRCAGPLEERPYSGRSDLSVECCRRCKGIYLDKGELLMVEDLAKAATAAFPPGERNRLEKKASRREALSAVYKTDNPVAKEATRDRAAFVLKVYLLLVVTLLVTAAGSLAGLKSSFAIALFFPAIIVEILLVIAVIVWRRVSGVNLVLLFAYTFVSGFTLSVVLLRYISMGQVAIIWQALATTAGIFIALSAYVHVTRRDLAGMGGFLFASLTGLLLSGMFLFFRGGPTLHFVWSLLSAVTFSGYVLFDTSNLLLKYETDEVVSATLDLYLDIVNLFLDILRVLSYLER